MKVNINKLKNGGSTPKLKQSLIERPKQDKKVIPVKQQGGRFNSKRTTDKYLWGIQNGQYTPEYTNAVNSIINNPILYKKITSNLNVKTPEEFKQLAFDNKIGPVHKSIVDVQNSTAPLPKDIVRYKSQAGKTEIPSEQFINIHKQEFDQQLSNFNNDSISAYNNLTKTLPNVQKIGKYDNLKSVENKTINPKNSYLFKAKLQEGGQLIPKGQNSLNTEVLPKIENFWGFQNGQYTKDYLNTVESIINNPQLYKKITSELNVSSPEEFRKLATDYKVDPIHNTIINNGAKPLNTRFNVSYNYPGTNQGFTVTPRQLIAGNKDLYDKELVNYNNDSTAALNNMVKQRSDAAFIERKPSFSTVSPEQIRNSKPNGVIRNFKF